MKKSQSYSDHGGTRTGIGADYNMYSNVHVGRARTTMRELVKAAGANRMRSPWLDVGAGGSLMRDTMQKHWPHLEIVESLVDLDEQPYEFPDNHFKVVTSLELIEHLYNPLAHMKEVRRVLHPDGHLFMTTPNDYSLIYKAEHLLSRKYRPHFHQFSERDMCDLMDKAGFRYVEIWKFRKSRYSGTLARISRNGLFIHAQK